MSGTVLFHSREKNYGFIKSKDCPIDIYFNQKGLYDPDEILPTNAIVSFDLVELKDGKFKAINTKRIG